MWDFSLGKTPYSAERAVRPAHEVRESQHILSPCKVGLLGHLETCLDFLLIVNGTISYKHERVQNDLVHLDFVVWVVILG